MSAPLLSRDEAARITQTWRGEGKTVVALSGSFDILHAGHRNLIAEARAAGDVLIVLLNSDASVRAYKGPGRPFRSEQDRAAAIAAESGVDAVMLFDEIVPLAAIGQLKPDVLANGPDYGADCVESVLVESYGGRILMTSPRSGENSTSAIAQRQGAAQNPRAILLAPDGILIEEDPEQVAWKDGAMAALARLRDAGFLLVLVTNQSGIGRGMFGAADRETVNRRIQGDLAEAGLALAGIYHCPHLPEDGCDCRKPDTGLVLQAAREHGLDLSKSWLVGDKCSDITAGRMTNMRTALVHSDAVCVPGPLLRAASLSEAVALILKS